MFLTGRGRVAVGLRRSEFGIRGERRKEEVGNKGEGTYRKDEKMCRGRWRERRGRKSCG